MRLHLTKSSRQSYISIVDMIIVSCKHSSSVIFIMGVIACHNQNYNEIINKHKDEIKRYIIEKKGKEFLDREIIKSRKLIAELTNRYENYNLQLISNKLHQLQ